MLNNELFIKKKKKKPQSLSKIYYNTEGNMLASDIKLMVNSSKIFNMCELFSGGNISGNLIVAKENLGNLDRLLWDVYKAVITV